LEADLIEVFLLEFDWLVTDLGGHVLIEDVLDIMGAIGVMQGGLFDGFNEGIRAIFVFEGEELFEILFDGLIGGGKAFEIGFGLLSEADKGGHLLRAPECESMFSGGLLMCGELNALFSLP
jgi:hypothetical protein